MANFTVEWLSQSYWRYTKEKHLQEEEEEEEVHKDTEEFTEEPKLQNSPTSPNNSCGYSSSSDSDSEGEAALNRRMRTKFTYEQIRKLETTFSKHKYLGSSQRRRIAQKLNLSETQVKTWFQNRRMKMKREAQGMRTEFLTVPAALVPPLLFQHHGLSGQLPARGAFNPRMELVRAPPQTLRRASQTLHLHPQTLHPHPHLPQLVSHPVLPPFY